MRTHQDFPRMGPGDEQCSWELCPFIVPVWHPCWQDRGAGPDGARHILQMSGRSPGVPSRGGGGGGGNWALHHWSVLESTVPAGVCLFLRAWLIDVLNRFRNACFAKGSGKMNTCIQMTSSSLRREKNTVCGGKSLVLGARGSGFYCLTGWTTILVWRVAQDITHFILQQSWVNKDGLSPYPAMWPWLCLLSCWASPLTSTPALPLKVEEGMPRCWEVEQCISCITLIRLLNLFRPDLTSWFLWGGRY